MRRVRQPASAAEACMATARSKERSLAAASSQGAPPDGLLLHQSVNRPLTLDVRCRKAPTRHPDASVGRVTLDGTEVHGSAPIPMSSGQESLSHLARTDDEH